jgi:septum formation protein
VSRPTLLLASASPARLRTLRDAGLDPLVKVSDVDEDATLAAAQQVHGQLAADEVALLLAKAKAEAVAALVDGTFDDALDETLDGVLVLGCDSVLELDGEIHGKPADAAEAVERWRRMSGGSGVLHTGHWLVDLRADEDGGTGATLGAVSSTTVHFAEVSETEIQAYVRTGEPLAVAGAFTTDGLGGAFVRGIEGDHHTVVGVSLPVLRELLAECAVTWTDLWSAPPAI